MSQYEEVVLLDSSDDEDYAKPGESVQKVTTSHQASQLPIKEHNNRKDPIIIDIFEQSSEFQNFLRGEFKKEDVKLGQCLVCKIQIQCLVCKESREKYGIQKSMDLWIVLNGGSPGPTFTRRREPKKSLEQWDIWMKPLDRSILRCHFKKNHRRHFEGNDWRVKEIVTVLRRQSFENEFEQEMRLYEQNKIVQQREEFEKQLKEREDAKIFEERGEQELAGEKEDETYEEHEMVDLVEEENVNDDDEYENYDEDEYENYGEDEYENYEEGEYENYEEDEKVNDKDEYKTQKEDEMMDEVEVEEEKVYEEDNYETQEEEVNVKEEDEAHGESELVSEEENEEVIVEEVEASKERGKKRNSSEDVLANNVKRTRLDPNLCPVQENSATQSIPKDLDLQTINEDINQVDDLKAKDHPSQHEMASSQIECDSQVLASNKKLTTLEEPSLSQGHSEPQSIPQDFDLQPTNEDFNHGLENQDEEELELDNLEAKDHPSQHYSSINEMTNSQSEVVSQALASNAKIAASEEPYLSSVQEDSATQSIPQDLELQPTKDDLNHGMESGELKQEGLEEKDQPLVRLSSKVPTNENVNHEMESGEVEKEVLEEKDQQLERVSSKVPTNEDVNHRMESGELEKEGLEEKDQPLVFFPKVPTNEVANLGTDIGELEKESKVQDEISHFSPVPGDIVWVTYGKKKSWFAAKIITLSEVPKEQHKQLGTKKQTKNTRPILVRFYVDQKAQRLFVSKDKVVNVQILGRNTELDRKLGEKDPQGYEEALKDIKKKMKKSCIKKTKTPKSKEGFGRLRSRGKKS